MSRKKATLSSSFTATPCAPIARSLTDGVLLSENVIMPWVGFGTYRLGKSKSHQATLDALQVGYRAIDTAFIYGGETTERQVGNALQQAFEDGVLSSRQDVFVITKHWRKYHGYEPTFTCLNLSLKRLQLDYVDLYLMHWPGPAWSTMHRKTELLQKFGKWHYAATPQHDMVKVRAETWRAMEDALKQGKVRAIGVSNFSIQHLETLKQTATIWPPAVNQVECHVLYPQQELLEYCQKEGIVLQAYAALGGQDATKAQWKELLGSCAVGGTTQTQPQTILDSPLVQRIAHDVNRTPAQILLRWALQRNCAVTPKTTSVERMKENANVFDFTLSQEQMKALLELKAPGSQGRLCWRTDPLRLLDFD